MTLEELIEKYEYILYQIKDNKINLEPNSCMDIIQDTKIRYVEMFINNLKGVSK